MMPAAPQRSPATLGPYELIERVATGGMAEVYLARRAGPRGFTKRLALKRILPQLAEDHEFVSMFVDEARVCARLGHPNIVQVFDFGEHEGELYMAMEYVDGTSAAKIVRSAAARDEDVPLAVILHVGLSILRGLEYAHGAVDEEGRPLHIVHRDVSPGNVLVDKTGVVKLTDFGIARAAEIERRTDAGQLKGKLGYMSPEQVVGKELDHRSDLFTAGIILAEFAILRPLFSGATEIDVLMRIRDADLRALESRRDRVPDDLRAVLYRALARDRAARYPTAADFAEALEEIARRRRLRIGPAMLADWLGRTGILPGAKSTEHEESPPPPTARFSGERQRRVTEPPPPASVQPEDYKLEHPDGTLVGPLSFPRLVELFATGKVPGGSRVARASGAFRDLGDMPELKRFAGSHAMRWDEPASRRGLQRPLRRLGLPARLYDVAARRWTGRVTVTDGPRRKKVFFVDGAPDFIASTDRTELLGEFLVRRGMLLRMEVEMALAVLPKYEGRFGEALVGLGVLRASELVRAVHDQMQDRFCETLAWCAGEVTFTPGERAHEETWPLALDTAVLVSRGIRQSYDEPELTSLLAHLAEDVVEVSQTPPLRLEWLGLVEGEARALAAVRPRVRLGAMAKELVDAKVAERAEVARALFIGLSAGWLRCGAFREATNGAF